MKRGFSSILLVVLIIIVAIMGGAYYFGKKSTGPTAANPIITQPQSSPAPLNPCYTIPEGLKIDNLLYLLIRTDCTQEAQSNAFLKHAIRGDKVQVNINVLNTDFVLNPQMGTEETRSGKIVQASVYISKLLDLASDPKIKDITLPNYGYTH